jgi:hypothetical protein
MIAPFAPQPAIDLLGQAIKRVRSDLDRAKPIKERVRAFWAGVKAARDLDASHVVHNEFRQLAVDVGLISDLGRHPNETLEHLISWGVLERDPFGKT